MKVYKPSVHPHEPPPLEDHELLALKAMAAGVASANQQLIALKTIVQKFAGTYDMSYRPGPDGSRATDFAEGKRFVGSRILEAIDRAMPTSQPEKPDARRSENPGGGSVAPAAAERAGRRHPKPASRRKPSREA